MLNSGLTKPPHIEWESKFFASGAYNKVYKSKDGNWVLKIQIIDKGLSPSDFNFNLMDVPSRSVRLWKLLNPDLAHKAFTEQSIHGYGWVCPYIGGGGVVTDLDIHELLLKIYTHNNGRVVVDAVGTNNCIKSKDGKVYCVDVACALQLETLEDQFVPDVRGRKSPISLDYWKACLPTFKDSYFKDWGLKFPISVNTIKALLFIKLYGGESIKNVAWLFKNHDAIAKLAQGFQESHRPAFVDLAKSVLKERADKIAGVPQVRSTQQFAFFGGSKSPELETQKLVPELSFVPPVVQVPESLKSQQDQSSPDETYTLNPLFNPPVEVSTSPILSSEIPSTHAHPMIQSLSSAEFIPILDGELSLLFHTPSEEADEEDTVSLDSKESPPIFINTIIESPLPFVLSSEPEMQLEGSETPTIPVTVDTLSLKQDTPLSYTPSEEVVEEDTLSPTPKELPPLFVKTITESPLPVVLSPEPEIKPEVRSQRSTPIIPAITVTVATLSLKQDTLASPKQTNASNPNAIVTPLLPRHPNPERSEEEGPPESGTVPYDRESDVTPGMTYEQLLSIKNSCTAELSRYINSRGQILDTHFIPSYTTWLFRNNALTQQKVQDSMQLIQAITHSATVEAIENLIKTAKTNNIHTSCCTKSGLGLSLAKCLNYIKSSVSDEIDESVQLSRKIG